MNEGNVVYTYNGILLSHKKKESLPFAMTWMNLAGIILSEISQVEKDKCCVLSFICGILKKKKSLIEAE